MNNVEKIINKINKGIVNDDGIQRVVNVLKSGFLSRPAGGPVVQEFQKSMAEMHGMKYAYATTSGTSSLHLAISALELKPNDEVIVPALSNIADCSVVIQEGAKPVFADIDPETFNINPKDIEKKITPKTRAIIVVHIYGEPADMDVIMDLAKKHGLIVIEDCAQASGARYKNKYVGSFGDISCSSFYQTKHIIIGEGGIVMTNNKKWFNIVDSLANNGIIKENPDEYDYDRIGYNYQMSEIQAALGISQLNTLDRMNEVRRDNAALYVKKLKDTDIVFQKNGHDSENSFFYLTGLLPEKLTNQRGEFLREVKAEGVPIKTLYPMTLPETKLLRDEYGSNCPIAKDIAKRLFNVYVNPGLEKEDIDYFCDVIKKIYYNISQ